MAKIHSTLRSSLTFKVFFIAFLVLILLIPMNMVENIIRERAHLYRQANDEITTIWGANHTFAGPVLTLPNFQSRDLTSGWVQKLNYKHLSPEAMAVNAEFETQLRYRGIYKVPVYLGKVSAKGKFILPEIKNLEIVDNVLIQIPFSKIKSLKEMPNLHWNGKPMILSPVADDVVKDAVIFQASVPVADLGKGEFEIFYEIAGSKEFNLSSSAKNTKLMIKSDWGSPRFHGQFFPSTHDIRSDGFTASWNINNVFVDEKESAKEKISTDCLEKHDLFGVKFIQLADTYQLVTRSAKYAVLFISLTFMIYFLVEILGGNKLHSIQYLFIGLSNCIFYLLLLSLSEHINFDLAYILSAGSSSLLIALYSKSALANS
ncbi:MAG: inner membrane protein, partial [Gammaproteobacteria bacterium]